MKIITWNCCGNINQKYKYISEFNSDVLVIPESGINQEIDKYEHNHWEGLSDSKGIGIYSKYEIKVIADIKINKYNNIRLDEFIPFITNNQLLIAVWTKGDRNSVLDYIGQLYFYLEMNKDFLDQKPIILGDFNSNTKWDDQKYDAWWKHSDLVKMLTEKGIYSIYHKRNNIDHGKEIENTSYHLFNKLKPNHIDYIFAPIDYINRTITFKIKPWNEIKDSETEKYSSDHCPIFWEYEERPTTAST